MSTEADKNSTFASHASLTTVPDKPDDSEPSAAAPASSTTSVADGVPSHGSASTMSKDGDLHRDTSFTKLPADEQNVARESLSIMSLMQQSIERLMQQYKDKFGETVPDDMQHVVDIAQAMSTLGSNKSGTVSAGSSSRRPESGNKHLLERSPDDDESKRQKASSFDISQWTVKTRTGVYAATVRRKSKSNEAVNVVSTSLIIRYKRKGDKKECTLTVSPSRGQLDAGPHTLVDFLFPIVKGVKCNRIWMDKVEKDRFPAVEKEADAKALADMALTSPTVQVAWTGFANDRETFWEKCKAHDAENSGGLEQQGEN
ncbi:hypothetical protein QFC24_003862 [Naganishia onofrii]|uniref:Uncharacterized protein n=1 Tax=Naganishia onofrii TaxID=1851511 RepID=A0ACC2XGQ9_9TREE|nr:hypothetical protein QFC24_003862 [Naganishia onofrii]